MKFTGRKKRTIRKEVYEISSESVRAYRRIYAVLSILNQKMKK